MEYLGDLKKKIHVEELLTKTISKDLLIEIKTKISTPQNHFFITWKAVAVRNPPAGPKAKSSSLVFGFYLHFCKVHLIHQDLVSILV